MTPLPTITTSQPSSAITSLGLRYRWPKPSAPSACLPGPSPGSGGCTPGASETKSSPVPSFTFRSLCEMKPSTKSLCYLAICTQWSVYFASIRFPALLICATKSRPRATGGSPSFSSASDAVGGTGEDSSELDVCWEGSMVW